jgi:Icc-related predicted phosphoesterase
MLKKSIKKNKNMLIAFISDTHGAKFHMKLQIPECDVVAHSGDIGGRTNTMELAEFLTWFEKLPAKKKIFTAGNHDLCLDSDWAERQKNKNVIQGLIAEQQYNDSKKIIESFDVVYLMNSSFEYEGVKFWGSPYSPSFHREHWAFNADRGGEIKQYWDVIPKDVDVLITHSPPKYILDKCFDDGFNAGCEELNKKLNEIQPLIHSFGHIHEGYGTHWQNKLLCINASVLNQNYQLVNKPILVEIDENKNFKLVEY